MKLNTHLRWWIVWTLFCSTVINYIDRQTLSVLVPVVTKELHMTHEDYSYVVSAFQIAYACMWLIGGLIIDLIGTRLGLTLAMIWWSISSMLPALARSMFSLAIFRFMLGMGEGFNLEPARPLPSGSRQRSAAWRWLFSTVARAWAR
jgi:MFS transporter, ACS family, hexuronate transporter